MEIFNGIIKEGYKNIKKDISEKEPFIINILKDKKIMLVGSEDASHIYNCK